MSAAAQWKPPDTDAVAWHPPATDAVNGTSSKSFMDHLSDAAREVGTAINPVNWVRGAANVAAHPVDFATNWYEQNKQIGQRALDSFHAGNYGEGLAHSLNYIMNAVPGLGAASDSAGEAIKSGDYGTGVGRAIGTALAMAGPKALGDVIPPAADAVAPALKTAVTQVLGKTTGAGAVALRQALENPSADLTNAMRGGVSEMDILGHAKDALQNIKDARAEEYQGKLAALPTTTPMDITPVRTALSNALAKHNVKIDANGDLDFSRSTISDSSAQNAVLSVYNDVRDWGTQPEDLTPKGFDILKRRIDDLYAPTSNARAVVQGVKSATRGALNSQVPGYQDMTQGYAEASKRLEELKDLSLESANPGTAIRKLTTILNQNNGYRQMLLEGLNQNSPVDIPGEVAGRALAPWMPRGIMGPLAGAGIAETVSHGIHPSALAALSMTSPRVMGELMLLLSKAKVPDLGDAGVAAATTGSIGNLMGAKQ
jgi:hypothetical protein